MANISSGHRRSTRRLHYAVLAVNIALILTSMLAFYAVWRVGKLSEATLEDHSIAWLYAQDLRREMDARVAAERAFLLTGDREFIKRLRDTEATFRHIGDKLLRRADSREERWLLDVILLAAQIHAGAVEQAKELRESGASAQEMTLFFEETLLPMTRLAQEAISDLLARKTLRLNEASESALKAADTAFWTLLILVSINLIFSAVMMPVTRRTLSELRSYASDLQEAVRARDDFLAIAGHELRTPVAVLKLQLQMVKRRISQGDPASVQPGAVEALVNQLERGVSNIALLINRILDVSNIDRGRLVLFRETVDLTALTKEVFERMMPAFLEKNCTVHYEPGEPVNGQWDRARLEQVISNLLMNVTRYAPGQLATIAVGAEGGKARLEVEDCGPGIATEDRERIFSRFERAHRAADGTGMGLGLAVSREIVQAHGGRIWLESEPGCGARFIMELPLSAEG